MVCTIYYFRIAGEDIPLCYMTMYIATQKVSQTQHFVARKIKLLTWGRYNLQLVIGPYWGENNTKYVKESNIKIQAASFILILPPFVKDFDDQNLHISIKSCVSFTLLKRKHLRNAKWQIIVLCTITGRLYGLHLFHFWPIVW